MTFDECISTELKAVQTFGIEAQTRQFAEEAAEAYIELNKFVRNRPDASIAKLAEELADLQIMINQMITWFDINVAVSQDKQAKYTRLMKKLENFD